MRSATMWIESRMKLVAIKQAGLLADLYLVSGIPVLLALAENVSSATNASSIHLPAVGDAGNATCNIRHAADRAPRNVYA